MSQGLESMGIKSNHTNLTGDWTQSGKTVGNTPENEFSVSRTNHGVEMDVDFK